MSLDRTYTSLFLSNIHISKFSLIKIQPQYIDWEGQKPEISKEEELKANIWKWKNLNANWDKIDELKLYLSLWF